MKAPKNAIVWVEVPVLNFDRAKDFYSRIFDFEMPEMKMGQNRMGFFLMEKDSEGVGGAIVQGEGYIPSKLGNRVYLSGGDDLTEILDIIDVAGGKVILGKTHITDEIGYYAVFEDTEGNHICLHSKK